MKFFAKSACEKSDSSSLPVNIIVAPSTEFSILDKQWSFSVPTEMEKMTDFEKMILIRSRKRQNQEKVRKFFGSELKIDVSLNMIDKFKLPAMIESDLPLAYFVCFLIKYQGIENLFFCLEVEKYNETHFESFESKRVSAQRIFNTFMENGIPMQINTKKENIEQAREKLKLATEENDNLTKIFSPTFMDIYAMLVSVYSDFEKNDFYSQMISDLSAANDSRDNLSLTNGNPCSGGSIYPLKAYYTALDLITASIGSMEKIYDDQMTSKRVSINRNRLTRQMIVSFCEKRLKLDFPESSLDLRQSLLTDISESIMPGNNNRASLISNLSAMSNISQSNSTNSLGKKRKDELDLF